MLTPLPDAAYAGALACLPGMGPATLFRLLGTDSPARVWAKVRSAEIVRPARGRAAAAGGAPVGEMAGDPRGGRPGTWADFAAQADVGGWWGRWSAAGIAVTWPGDAAYPERLRRDPEPPGVLFWRGRLEVLAGPCVAVVGTRRCTPGGRSVAYGLGLDLAAAGVCVVSGLAAGIDGAAHAGAVDARRRPPCADPGSTVGVAASGVDVAYPPQHRVLWEQVVASGAVLSETPPGRPAQAWRFPSRNRVIAGLADLVVVVESHQTGGALITADRAIERGIEVRVVPGPVHAPASAGSNQLLYDGPGPIRDAADVLDALGLIASRPRRAGRPRLRARAPAPAALPFEGPAARDAAHETGRGGRGVRPTSGREGRCAREERVLEALGWAPTSLDAVLVRTGLGLGEVAATLERLREEGVVAERRGWWSRVPDG